MQERSGMPYDVVAYEADDLAMQLNEAEEGLFHRMLRRSWMNGSIPAEMNALASICRTHPAKLKRAWIRIEPLWKPHPSLGGRLINLKQERERAYKDSKSKSARLSAVKRWNSAQTNKIDNANALPTQSERNAPPSPSPSHSLSSTNVEERIHKTPAKRRSYSDDFETFWKAYPKKVGKGDAEKAWMRNGHPGIEEIVRTIERAKRSSKWLEEGGKYIPNPEKWLNGKRWDDEYVTVDSEQEAANKRVQEVFGGRLR